MFDLDDTIPCDLCDDPECEFCPYQDELEQVYLDSLDDRAYNEYMNDTQRWDGNPHNAPFADPGGRSALRAGARIYPCPTCGRENQLTKADVRLNYQCDFCADCAEGFRPCADY